MSNSFVFQSQITICTRNILGKQLKRIATAAVRCTEKKRRVIENEIARQSLITQFVLGHRIKVRMDTDKKLHGSVG